MSGRIPVLDVRHLTVRYGGVTAVDDVSLAVPEHSVVGLIGPNGAGKTTLVDALSGYTRYAGQVRFHGAPIDSLKPHQRARRGIARTFQSGGSFDDLTVEENILIGERRAAGWMTTLGSIVTGRPERQLDETKRVISALRLEGLLLRDASGLSAGQLKLVSVARALAGRPDLIILDEPAAGLDSTESAWLGGRLGEVRDAGATILLVDHDMDLIQGLCDEIYVLNFGQVIANGSPEEVMSDPEVIEAYLGSSIAGPDVAAPTGTGASA